MYMNLKVNDSPYLGFFMGVGGSYIMYLENREQIRNNVGMIGHTSSEDTQVLGGFGGMLYTKTFEI